MKAISIGFVAALSLTAFGCKKGGAGGGDCSAAIGHSMDLSKDAMAKSGLDPKILEKMKNLGLQHCTDDKWSGDVTKCMIDAKTEKESGACYAKLTPDQQEKMNKAAMELMTANIPTPAPAPPAGSAAATPPPSTDTGSAGSAGSAAPAAVPAGSAAAPK